MKALVDIANLKGPFLGIRTNICNSNLKLWVMPFVEISKKNTTINIHQLTCMSCALVGGHYVVI